MTLHFLERAEQRGPKSVKPEVLRDAVTVAFAAERWDLLEHVIDLDSGNAVYRLKVQGEGLFYVVISRMGRPLTLLTHDMVKGYKKIKRGKVGSVSEYNFRQMMRPMMTKGARA